MFCFLGKLFCFYCNYKVWNDFEMFDFGIFNDMYNKSFDFQGNVCSWNLRKKSQVSNNNGDLKKKNHKWPHYLNFDLGKKISGYGQTWITPKWRCRSLSMKCCYFHISWKRHRLACCWYCQKQKNAIFIHITTILTFQRYQKNSKTVFIYNTTMH